VEEERRGEQGRINEALPKHVCEGSEAGKQSGESEGQDGVKACFRTEVGCTQQ
jgi:hypothetical protein